MNSGKLSPLLLHVHEALLLPSGLRSRGTDAAGVPGASGTR